MGTVGRSDQSAPGRSRQPVHDLRPLEDLGDEPLDGEQPDEDGGGVNLLVVALVVIVIVGAVYLIAKRGR